MASLTTNDRLEIQELTARHFYAIDGLHRLLKGDPAVHWADTFTEDGTFEIHTHLDEVLFSVTGRQSLIEAQRGFPDIDSTRHWIGDLLIEEHPEGARSGSYIIAMNISVNPAATIRTGVYDDLLVKVEGSWKFKSKILILDAMSPSAE
jgi:hypothetical protein